MSKAADALFMLADEHDGIFTAREAADVGISRQNLVMLARRGALAPVARGIYRLVNYPANQEQIQLWEAALWPSIQRTSHARGTLSHLTALHLHYPELEFVPAVIDLTIPPGSRVRREKPKWLRVHFGRLLDGDVTIVRGLPVTTLERSFFDSIATHAERRLLKSVIDAAEKDAFLTPATTQKLRRELSS